MSMLIDRFGLKREKCVNCEKPSISICKSCGVLCCDHDAMHRHETGHITILLNWREIDQPTFGDVV